MTLRRLAHLTAATALALTLSACGGSEEDSTSSDSGASSESAEEAPEESDATGEDYVAMLETFRDNPAEGDVTAEEYNASADLPEGFTMEELDREAETFCLQDTNKDIAFRLSSGEEGNFELLTGACEGGEVAAAIVEGENPDSDDLNEAIAVEGDEELARPVIDFLQENIS